MSDLSVIRLVPDPVLRARAAEVTAFGAELREIAEAMLDTMYAAPGRGLAGPQVGLGRRIFVMDTAWKDGAPAPRVFVNPEIVARSERQAVHAEGCLSIPGRMFRVSRPAEVRLAWQDPEGGWHEESFTGFDAVCVQHERDHLDGILCSDYPEAPPEPEGEKA